MVLLITSVFGVTGCGSDDGELGESKQEVAEVQEESETAPKSEPASPTTTTVPPTPTTTTTLPALKARGGQTSFGCEIIDGLAENNLETLYQGDYEDYLDDWGIRFYGNLRDQLENLNEYEIRVTLATLDDRGLLEPLDLVELTGVMIQYAGFFDRYEPSRQDMNDLLDLLELHDVFMGLDSLGLLESLDIDDSDLLELWYEIDERDLSEDRAYDDSEASVVAEDLRLTLDLVWGETFFDRDLRDFLDQMDSLDYRDRSAVPDNGDLFEILYESEDWDLVAFLEWRDLVDDFDLNYSVDIALDGLYSLFNECKYEGTLSD
tara:strand:+ start:159 stop:1118 length:960 start_codon:yes stop_codon:yes gene_type:complete